MSFYGGIIPYESFRYGFGYIDTIQRQRAVTPARQQISVAVQRRESIEALQEVMRMREAVQAAEPTMLASQEVQVASPASAASASSLDLNTTSTSATLQSTEEVNASATSFSTDGSQWAGSSTAQATISGTYDGSNGTDTLTFKVSMGGTHGPDKLKIEVYDSSKNQIKTININKKDAIDKQYNLDNGLVLSLGEGDLIAHDTFTVNVDDTGPPSYSPSEPQWAGSTTEATIGGIYDGSNGTDTLTFSVTAGGTHGTDNLQLTVYDSSSNQIDQIDINSQDSIDQQYSLSNGLTLTLGEGNLVEGSSYTVEVFGSQSGEVNPDNPFSGTGNDGPNLEAGFSVSDGSFDINGTTIDVNASDSINMVLDRITQSDAGVTATFDAAAEKVLLTQKTSGSTPDIFLANDTSGFLPAVKLDGATATPGTDAEADKALIEVDAFSTVQSGSIKVNGVAIDIDVNSDSLNDVLERISASSAGVDANFSSATQKVYLSADSSAQQMVLSSGVTSFFSAVGIAEGTYNSADGVVQATIAGMQIVDVTEHIVDSFVEENTTEPWEIEEPAPTPRQAANGEMMTTLVGIISNSMNRLFDDSAFSGSQGSFLEGVRNNIRSAISSWSGSNGTQVNTDFGINFDFEKTREGVFKFSPADQHQFKAALAIPQTAAAVSNALFGQDASGLFSQLHASLNASVADLDSGIDATGLFLDITA